MISETTAAASTGNHHDEAYDAYLHRVQQRFLANLQAGGSKLFTTDAGDLFATYLDAFPSEHRQYHNCHACRQFINRFGGLVTISPDGAASSAMWDASDAPELYRASITAMERMIRRAKVNGVFLSSEPVWGSPVTGQWHHFAVTPPKALIFKRSIQTAFQASAEKHEDYGTVQRALAEFMPEAVAQAVTLLKTDSLYRSEKCLGVAEWLAALHASRSTAKGNARDNVVWRAVALAPAGFCHPRSSMIGTLLEDIAAGMNFTEVSKRFAAKMHPLQYQRPQAAPSAGNIAQAEKIVEQMGLTASLRRRFARLDEVEAVWRPAQQKVEPSGAGVFAHLKPKSTTPDIGATDMPAITMTWDKFRRTVLPDAQEIEFYAPRGNDNYAALVTAVDPDAPPLLQWDSEDKRNPVSWYLWNGGSSPSQWGLTGGAYHKVSAVSLKPYMWGDDENKFEHQGQGVLFILADAKESRTDAGLALFPETLRSELREIRSTIEAFSRSGELEGKEDASACGIILSKGGNWSARFRVRTSIATVEYKLDRWD